MKVVAHFGEVAASGGYYCACGADKYVECGFPPTKYIHSFETVSLAQ